jgi:hypothetical protein
MIRTILLAASVMLGATFAPLVSKFEQSEKKQKKAVVPQVQPTRESWAWRYGGLRYDAVKSVLRTRDGGFIIAGDTRSFMTDKKKKTKGDYFNVWVVRLDSTGQIVWQRMYVGPKSDNCSGMIAAADGGYMLVGTTDSYGAGMSDVWVVRLDDEGQIVWQKTFGGEKNESGAAIVRDADGSYIIVGDTESFIPAEHEGSKWHIKGRESRILWAFKIKGDGEMVWQKSYVTESAYCRAQSIVSAGDGDFVLGSSCQRFLWLVKVSGETGRTVPTDADASSSWSRSYYSPARSRHYVRDSEGKQVELANASGIPFDTMLTSLVATGDGFAMSGEKPLVYSEDGSIWDCLDCAGWMGYWIASLDANGEVKWAKTLGEGVPGYSTAFSLSAARDGLLVAGDLNSMPQPPLSAAPWSIRRSHTTLLRFEYSGELAWQKEIGGNKDGWKTGESDPEVFALGMSSGEHIVARTFILRRGTTTKSFT